MGQFVASEVVWFSMATRNNSSKMFIFIRIQTIVSILISVDHVILSGSIMHVDGEYLSMRHGHFRSGCFDWMKDVKMFYNLTFL